MDPLVNMLSTAGNRLSTNLRSSFTDMTPEKWIRLVIIVGAYLLLRPYLIKLGAKAQMQAHEKDEKDNTAEISPNQLRGQIDIPEDSDDEEGVAPAATASDWGKKARRRQREVIKKLLDAEERRLQEQQEDEEDKDIEEFLIKE
jgi:hypothetical protein